MLTVIKRIAHTRLRNASVPHQIRVFERFMAPSWVVRAHAQSGGAGHGSPAGVCCGGLTSRGAAFPIPCLSPAFRAVALFSHVPPSVGIIYWEWKYLCLIFLCPLLLSPKNCLNDGNSQSRRLTAGFAASKSLNFRPN